MSFRPQLAKSSRVGLYKDVFSVADKSFCAELKFVNNWPTSQIHELRDLEQLCCHEHDGANTQTLMERNVNENDQQTDTRHETDALLAHNNHTYILLYLLLSIFLPFLFCNES